MELNRAVAFAMAYGPAAGLEIVEPLLDLEDSDYHHDPRDEADDRAGPVLDVTATRGDADSNDRRGEGDVPREPRERRPA